MFYIGPGADEATDEHEGYVAGRRPDGSLTGIWTDVRTAGVAVIAYVPACECGWSGDDQPVTPAGHDAAQRRWLTDHFRVVAAELPGLAGAGVAERDFLWTGVPAAVRGGPA
ncbi:hypothetical protein [Pseudonocardia acidicola]|uniref:Uncharacterized protein n=1 Tax=Pseudonocardia acidicola TaxID=2724939 RepID=A0ABX1SBW6_9PSEU|nr:hypothetical protein [Pseudonocardia acidicola]NMH98357.1 hypothetical protein [Pseudonocardia acidicola]